LGNGVLVLGSALAGVLLLLVPWVSETGDPRHPGFIALHVRNGFDNQHECSLRTPDLMREGRR
jgi:hypothetical protein